MQFHVFRSGFIVTRSKILLREYEFCKKVISHSNILKAALPRSRWKCGSGEGAKHVFDVCDF